MSKALRRIRQGNDPTRSGKAHSSIGRIDRRPGWVRLGALGGGVVLAAVLVISTGLKPHDLYDWWHKSAAPVAKPSAPIVPGPRSVKNIRHEDPTARYGTDSSASKVPLSLHLVRTLPGPNSHAGQALLGVDPAHPQTYLAGAILENGARLQEIYQDHVVLARGSQHTSLYLDARGNHARTGKSDALTLVGGPTPMPVESPHLSVEPVTDYLRPVPVYRGGIVVGLQVYPGAHTAPFTNWGLKPGDLMTDLDGQPLSDSDQLMQTLRGLIEGETLHATVQRAGVPVSITLQGADVQRLRTANNTTPPPQPTSVAP